MKVKCIAVPTLWHNNAYTIGKVYSVHTDTSGHFDPFVIYDDNGKETSFKHLHETLNTMFKSYNEKPKVIILSGISGSGKSFLAEKLGREHEAANKGREAFYSILSADDFFTEVGAEGGDYRFDPSRIGEAHADCFLRFVAACQRNKPLVIVDNTNTEVWEIAPYMLAADAYGYDAEIIVLMCDELVAFERNQHGVPLGEIERQRKKLRLLWKTLPSHWNNVSYK